MKNITYKGHTYRSILELSRSKYCKVSYSVLRRNLLIGMSVGKALTFKKENTGGRGKKRRSLLINNEYMNQAEFREKYKMSYATYKKRIDAGASHEDALLGGQRRKILDIHKAMGYNGFVFIDPDGNKFPDWKNMALAHNVVPRTFINRIRNGIALADALKYKTINPNPGEKFLKHTVSEIPERVTFGSTLSDWISTATNEAITVSEACRVFLTPVVAYKALTDAGVDEKDVLNFNFDVPTKDNCVRIKNKDFFSVQKAIDYFANDEAKPNPTTIYKKMYFKKMNFSSAVLEACKESKPLGAKKIKDPWTGQKYPSISALANIYHKDGAYVAHLLRNGVSLKAALAS